MHIDNIEITYNARPDICKGDSGNQTMQTLGRPGLVVTYY